jgi:choline-sulfatase
MRWLWHAARSTHDHGLRAASALAAEWVDDTKNGGGPAFLFMNLMECHSPYLPPAPYNDLGAIERLKAGHEALAHGSLEAIWRTNLARTVPGPAALRRMRYLYSRAVLYVDDWLGQFLRSLDAAGLAEDTLVLVTSDHGENLGEGDRIGHSFSLDNRLVRVPLIAVNPSSPPPHRVFSLVDLPALIAEEIGLRDHPWQSSVRSREVAVSELDGVGEYDDPRVADFIARQGLDDSHRVQMTQNSTCATDGRLKLVDSGGELRLFDLAADPWELAGATPGESTAWREPAVGRLRAALDHAAQTAGTAPSAIRPSSVHEETEEAERLAAQMRLLGYL